MAWSVHRRLLDVIALTALAGTLFLPLAAAQTAPGGAAGAAPTPAPQAAPGSPPDATAKQLASRDIATIIRRQIAAFKRDDGATAFSFADKTIQQLFVSPARFMRMVSSGYPMIYRAASLEFGPLDQQSADRALQPIGIGDDQGRLWLAIYSMIRRDGQWRIAGVQVQATRSSQI